MRWFWKPKRAVIEKAEFSELLYRALDHYSEPLLDTEYVLFDDIADFLNTCPYPKKYHEVKYNCNRQLMEVTGKLQGFAVGNVIIPWRKKVNHAMLIVCCKDRIVRLFDVNARTFVAPHYMKAVKVWI